MILKKRLLGIDYGKVRIGTAISDPLGITAQPLSVIIRKNISSDIEEMKKLIDEYEVDKIVLGNPISLKGEKEIAANEAEKFSELLKKELNIPIILWDERLSTKEAQRIFQMASTSIKKRKENIDKLSAALILQNYLDRQKKS